MGNDVQQVTGRLERRLVAFLQRRGFGGSVIGQVLREVLREVLGRQTEYDNE